MKVSGSDSSRIAQLQAATLLRRTVPASRPTPGAPAPARLTATGEQRVEAADRALSQTSQLLDDVREGLGRNASTPNPQQANERLLRSAAETVTDLVDNTRVGGAKVFGGVASGMRQALAAYAKSDPTPAPVLRAMARVEGALRQVPGALGSLPVGSAADIDAADTRLASMGERIRSAQSELAAAARPNRLDLSA